MNENKETVMIQELGDYANISFRNDRWEHFLMMFKHDVKDVDSLIQLLNRAREKEMCLIEYLDTLAEGKDTDVSEELTIIAHSLSRNFGGDPRYELLHYFYNSTIEALLYDALDTMGYRDRLPVHSFVLVNRPGNACYGFSDRGIVRSHDSQYMYADSIEQISNALHFYWWEDCHPKRWESPNPYSIKLRIDSHVPDYTEREATEMGVKKASHNEQ